MGVSRTDYLMWGAKIDPDQIDCDKYEAEMYEEEGRRFDIVYDGMSGQYAVAGKIIAKSDPNEGLDFQVVPALEHRCDHATAKAVMEEFGHHEFNLYLFSHFR